MHSETLDTPKKIIGYTRDIGALGGTLTLRFERTAWTLTGDDLIRAANTYKTQPFTIWLDDNDPEPSELTESEEWAPYDPGSKTRFLAIAGAFTLVAGVLCTLFML